MGTIRVNENGDLELTPDTLPNGEMDLEEMADELGNLLASLMPAKSRPRPEGPFFHVEIFGLHGSSKYDDVYVNGKHYDFIEEVSAVELFAFDAQVAALVKWIKQEEGVDLDADDLRFSMYFVGDALSQQPDMDMSDVTGKYALLHSWMTPESVVFETIYPSDIVARANFDAEEDERQTYYYNDEDE